MVSRKQGKESIVKNGSLFRGSVASVSALVLIFPALSLGGPTTTIQPPAARTSATSRPPAENAADRAGEPLAPFDRVEVGLTPELSRDAAARRPAVYGKLPLIFEANRGQTDSRVKFLSRGNGYTLFLTATETVLALAGRRSSVAGNRFRGPRPDATMPAETESGLVRMQFIGANPEPSVTGLEELPGKANYFIGRDPTKWRTNVPTYARVEYRDIYPGVNLVYFGDQRQLEYDFVVRPGASPEAITLGFQGADKLEVDAQGDLVLHTAVGAIRQRRPFVYQEVGGARREIAGGYVLRGAGRVGFQVAAYDRSQPLVIDPVLSYATYLGGSRNDNAFGIAVDASGNAYVTGYTVSTDFPTTAGAFQPTFGGGTGTALFGTGDAFVAKLNATGSGLVYSTYLGGSGDEGGYGIAVDASGNAYVAGITDSTDFPTTAGAFQPTFGGGSGDAFVTKLAPTGSALAYSTYVGGSALDRARGIAVDALGNAYVTGLTVSTDFPTTAGAFQTGCPGPSCGAGFVTKLNPPGTTLVYSTYLGGNNSTGGTAIAVDAVGNASVTGSTAATDFPTTAGALQTSIGGPATDAYETTLNPTGSGLIYSTYLGGTDEEDGFAIAGDASGNVYVTGRTRSTNFPTTAGAFQPTFGGGIEHAFVTKLNPTSSAVAYSTFLGGSFAEQGTGIVVDASGNAYVAVRTESTDFPTTAGAFQPTFGGSEDAAVTELNPSGSALVYSAYLGGSNSDVAYGIAVDASGDAYVAGITASANFPTTAGAFQTTRGGGDFDAFVAKVSPNTPAGTNVSVSAGNGVTVTFTAVASPGETAAPTSSTGPTPPAGFTVGTPPTYYNIQTTATYGPPVSVCITYNPAQFGDPSMLHLFHFENNVWVDVTTSIDTSKHVICGTVNSLSPFAIFQKLPPPTDMAISKGGPSRVSSGSNLTYGIGVVNLGPNTASGVVVTDRVPAGTSFVSAQFAKGSCTVSGGTVSCTMSQPGTPCAFSNGTVTCDIGTLSPYTPANPAGAGVQLVVNVTAPRGATITNTATVSASNPDPNQANDSSTATTSVR